MSNHHEANDRAMRRCEEAYLREPEPPACEACGEPTRDGAALCEECAPVAATTCDGCDAAVGDVHMMTCPFGPSPRYAATHGAEFVSVDGSEGE